MRRRGSTQLELPASRGWGGARPGSGRKRASERPSPPHRPRVPHSPRCPVHVTLRACSTVPSLRSERVFVALRRALAASMLLWFRIVHFSVQRDHVHLIVEADDAPSFTSGIQGLAARSAKAINRASGRRGRVWSGRYHAHALRTPTETRRGIAYVLLNFRKHLGATGCFDPRSSGPCFDGWRGAAPRPANDRPVATPRTWLASAGWRRAGGLIETDGLAADKLSRRPRP
jgi:REP element-mobilizing transposase RayT